MRLFANETDAAVDVPYLDENGEEALYVVGPSGLVQVDDSTDPGAALAGVLAQHLTERT